MHYGGDYNPEQWPEEIWPEDVALMREAGVTMVSLGIFSWSRIQPAEGVFDFDWLDRVIELLHARGIAVDLATATASPPPWASTSYPEMLPQRADGTVLGIGSRQAYAPSSPVYRRLASELVTRLAERYAAHPAVVMWHVNNEYGCHVNADYSDAARDAFRRWLAARYGDVDALNAAWGTAFWSQRYGSFDEVLPPRAAPYSLNPAQLLDFQRFTSAMLIECYLMEKEILLAAGATQPITTNFMGAFKPADYAAWAEHVDVVTDDCYPDPNDPNAFRHAAFQRDLIRGLKPEVPWLLMEQSSNALNWRSSNAPKAPGQMAALSMQAVARGADGILFFQWRQSRAGSEKFHSAMLPQAGTDTRTWREVAALGSELAALPQQAAGGGEARVALVFDWENWWAVENPDHPTHLDYVAVVKAWHAAALSLHVQLDVVRAGDDLSGYAVVIAPSLYLLRETDAAALTAFTAAGGHLLVTAFSDVVDENDAFRSGGFTTQLREVLGVDVEDFGALVSPSAAAEEPGERVAPVESRFGAFDGHHLAEELRVRDAEVVGSFAGGRLAGRPALTVNDHGAGRAWYLATVADSEAARTVLAGVFAAAGAEPVLPWLPDDVEAVRRGEVTTLINHGPTGANVAVRGMSVLGGERVESVELAPFEYVLLVPEAVA